MKEKMKISPLMSQVFGSLVSTVTGLLVTGTVWGFIAYELDFWYIGDVLGPLFGIICGGLSGFEMYVRRRREVPINWIGISLYLGKPTGRFYENGIHWVFPLFGILNCPAQEKKFILEMPGEKINAQDGIAVFFGVDEPAHPGKHNRLQYSVIDPIKYMAVDDPEDSLKEEFIEKARLFFGQMAKAIGVKNVKLLFDEWIELSTITPETQATHKSFAERLTRAEFETNSPEHPEIFTLDAVTTIMQFAGEFKKNARSWGIGEITVFTPNVRVNPEAEKAAEQKQAATEQMEGLQTKVNKIKKLAREMTAENKVNPDLAATLVAGLSGQQVVVENKTINVSGLPEVLKSLGEMAINKWKGGSNDND